MLAALVYMTATASVVLICIWMWDSAWERIEAKEKKRRMDDLALRRAIRDAQKPQKWTYKDAA